MIIARPSVASLLLEPSSSGGLLGVATGFVVQSASKRYLITNRHVVTGRHQTTGQPLHASGGLPDQVGVLHHLTGRLGNWERRSEPLFDSRGKPRWLIHPSLGESVDVVALALTDTAGLDFHAYPLDVTGPELALDVSSSLFIIGFPFGITGGGAFGVWSKGSVATEPAIDWRDLPLMLVDSRTRPGQSGSPVVQYVRGGAAPLADGSTAVFGGPVERLVGVYSGRVNSESDLGFVWKVRVVSEILEGKRKETR